MTTKSDFLLPEKRRPLGIGKNLYLLGTAEDGPLLEPMLISTKKKAREIFGDENRGTLVKAFDEAYDSNREISIFLMRITGKSATLEVVDLNPDSGELGTLVHAHSIYAGTKYNNVFFDIQPYDEEKMALELHDLHGVHIYPIDEYITLGDLAQQVNRDCRAGKHPVLLSVAAPHMRFMDVHPNFIEAYLEEGEDGTDATKDDLYLASDIAYNILKGRPVDIIVPVGMYLDDVHPAYLYGESMYGSAFYSSEEDYLRLIDTYNHDKVVSYHEQLIEFCREQIQLGYMTHGVIGFKPLRKVPLTIESDDSYILRIVEATAFRDRYGLVEYTNGYWIDKGFYISVVSAELVYNEGTPKEYIASGAARYGAIASGYFDTTSNLSVGDDVSLRYELSDSTRSQLSKLGIVTFRDSIRLGLVVGSGVTAAIERNDYHNFANTRMVQLAIAFMNEAVTMVYESDYAGEMRRTFLEELVIERLDQLSQAGIIEKFGYEIRFLNDDSMGEIILQLQTKYSLEALVVSAEVRPGGT